MPQPNRPTPLIEDDLGRLPVSALIEQGVRVGLACEACHHRAVWDAADLEIRFGDRRADSLRRIAAQLRCGRCRCEWVWVFREAGNGSGTPR